VSGFLPHPSPLFIFETILEKKATKKEKKIVKEL
jgi:hypothetical protein